MMPLSYKSKCVKVLKFIMNCAREQYQDELLISDLFKDQWEKERAEVEYIVITTEIFLTHLRESVIAWHEKKVTLSENLAKYTLNLAGILSKNEEKFCSLNNNNFYIKLINVSGVRQTEIDSSIKLSFIKLLSAFLQHKSGIEWMIGSVFWQDILQMCLIEHKYQANSRKFIREILEKSIDVDEDFCHTVVNKLVQPISENLYLKMKVDGMETPQSEVISKNLKLTLNFIADLLVYFMEEKNFKIMTVFLKNFQWEERISDFMIIVKNTEFTMDLSKIVYIMQFLTLYFNTITKNFSEETVQAGVNAIKDNFIKNLFSNNYEIAMDFCYFGIIYWNTLNCKVAKKFKQISDEIITFLEHCTIQETFPLYCVSFRCWQAGDLEDTLIYDDVRSDYVMQILKKMDLNCFRSCIYWRDSLIQSEKLLDFVTQGINNIVNLRRYYSKSSASTILKSFIYTLRDISSAILDDRKKFDIFKGKIDYFSAMFNAIAIFMDEFKLTWSDSVETINMLSWTYEFLTIEGWEEAIIFNGLKLLDISIIKNMSPDLILLMDVDQDSTLKLLGPLLYSKLQGDDDKWKVRFEALKVVTTISKLSQNSLCIDMEPMLSKHLFNFLLNWKSEAASEQLHETAEIEEFLLNSATLPKWVMEIVKTWQEEKKEPPADLALLILNSTILLSRFEDKFTCLNSNNYFVKLVNITGCRQKNAITSVKFAYIQLLSSFLQHESGIEWMISSNFWEDILHFNLNDENTAKESLSFLIQLIKVSFKYNIEFCNDLVKKIIHPLNENIIPDNDEKICTLFKSTLELIANIFEALIDDVKLLKIVLIFLNKFRLEDVILGFMVRYPDSFHDKLNFNLRKIDLLIQFVRFYFKVLACSISPTDASFALEMWQIEYNRIIMTCTIQDYMEFVKFGIYYWNLILDKIGQRLVTSIGELTTMKKQVCLMELYPIFSIVVKYCFEKKHLEECKQNDEIRDAFTQKFYKTAGDSIRIWYECKKRLIVCQDLFAVSIKSLAYLRDSLKYHSKEDAVIIFQGIMYLLKDILATIKLDEKKLDIFITHNDYFVLIFNTIAILIEEFKITWSDAVESINVMTMCFDFMSCQRDWTKDIIVEIIKVINILISMYMTPNLTLLLDNETDSTMAMVGPMLYNKLQDENSWMVRRTAMEVVYTISHMADGSKLIIRV